ncbi:cell adhesion molecule Dscam1 isoform X2 [Planococcus citri]|uniref:cell adhesion molecule Dscam1 isoform X2 n=1 Tax=Planococcus citri TaxID=170843 RepID=UPI0031F89036
MKEIKHWVTLLLFPSALCLPFDVKGPQFTREPPTRLHFSNDTGAKIDCIATGTPPALVEWILGDGRIADTVPNLRTVYSNGTLIFSPFTADLHRSEIHSRDYRCRARNTVGQIISRVTNVNAVLKTKYEVQVYDETVVSGNIAILRCIVPSSVSEYVSVTSWVQDNSITIFANNNLGDKYIVVGNRDLYIYNVSAGDSYNGFICRTINRLTGEIQTSAYPARITVTEPEGMTPPKLLVDKQNKKKVGIDEHITLSCASQGYPVPMYRWFREEKENLKPVIATQRMKFGPPGLLQIQHVQYVDQGKYICIVNNSLGEEKVQISLTVTSSLTSQMIPTSEIIKIGKTVEFTCKVSGSPVNKVSWYHNGQLISNDKRYYISNNPDKLTISPLVKEDYGMYQCFASNEWTMTQSAAQLLLGDVGPEIIHSFSEQTLQPGPSLSLKCVATGNPPPSIIWKLDGFPIPDSSRFMVGQYQSSPEEVVSHVNITTLKDVDGGEYSCTAKNSVAQSTRSARINVYGLPFIRPMSKITAISGSRLIIKCPVAGYPIESITWEQGGVLLPVNRRQRAFPNGTLIIDQIQRASDAGTYTCQAQNRQKQNARRDVEVQVLVPPKIMPIPPLTNLLQEGNRAGITCQVVEGDLPINFRWEKSTPTGRTVELGAVTRRIDEYTSALIIEKITPSHSGNYTCIAQNNAGEEKLTVPVTVNVPPHWIVEPKDISISAGKDLMLHCKAEGYPVPTIVWKKAIGQEVGEYKDFIYEPNLNLFLNGSLQFLHVNKKSEGHYLCEAKNEIGSGVSKVIFLKVNTPVHFVQKSRQLNILKGDAAHLQCNALGDNPIDIIWTGSKNQPISNDVDPRYSIRDQILDEGKISELGITKVFRHDTGAFTCHAKNNYGQDEMTIQLIVQEIPETPKNIRIAEQGSKSITLSWTQPYAGNSPIINYVVQNKLASAAWSVDPAKVVVPSTKTSAVVENLTPASTYHFRILAENSIGLSEPSEMIQITTQEEAPSGPPREVKVSAKSSTELNVTWESPAKDLWNGNLLGYNVGYQEISDTVLQSTPNGTSSPLQYSMKTVDIGSDFGGHTIITGLNMYSMYSIIVQAFNSRGPGPFSDPISARTDEGVPSVPPENVKCMALTSQSIQISWNPPVAEGQNGVIQGYKVFYQPAEDWYEKNDYVTKTVTPLVTTIGGLMKYTNYSFFVRAYTKPGDGVKSNPVYCRTEEDVPMAPAGIKAYPSSTNKIIISWLPPLHKNGELTGYTFYMALRSGGKEEETHKRKFQESVTHHEIARSLETATYQFWVTASTKVGEGESTAVITVPPSLKVSARILSFSQQIITPWKKNITLPCQKVGNPVPKLVWKLRGKVFKSGERFEINKDGSLIIYDIQRTDGSNYTCYVENIHGKDEIIYSIIVREPPDPPELTVVNEDTDSLQLAWKDTAQPDIPVLGYVINYKRDHGDWEEIQIDSKTDTYLLRNLWCGTKYQLYMTAYNKIGTGLPCDIVTAYTKGSVPVSPVGVQQGMTYNTTAAGVWLDMWNDGGCSILYFIVEYKKEMDGEWKVSPKPVSPSDRIYVIYDLIPATRYQLRITAHNNIGSTVQVYNFTTLNEEGGTVIPMEFITYASEIPSETVFSPVTSIVSIAILIFILTTVFITICYFKKKRFNELNDICDNVSVGAHHQRHQDQQYGIKNSRSQQTLSADPASCKTDSTEYIDEICPYATFQLAKPAYTESTFSGNVYSGPYHSVGGSFVYHNVKSTTSSIKPKHSKDYEYTKVRRTGGKIKDIHSESQESDNFGSTDSEVKKILTLHLPISEYDTLGSDSEYDGRQINNQELVSFRHIGPSRGGSSSSSEISPTDARKPAPPPMRKPKNKSQLFGKRAVKSSSGYSSHTEETTFSFSNRINPPSRFSDRPHSRGPNENDANFRRSSRGGGRFTQETSFQIDV